MTQSRSRRHAGARATFAGLLLVAAFGPAHANGPPRRTEAAPAMVAGHAASLRIPPSSQLPQTRKVIIGLDKSMLVEVPVDLQNVLVSNPEVLDAVVQTSRQVYLLAKGPGEANAFFMGHDGQKVLLLEVYVQRDLAPLTEALTRLLPGSRVKAESVGENVVLSGSVVNAVDANRAADLAARYVKKKDSVVNMLSVDAKEQVMLKVTVAEIQRESIRRLGVDLPKAILASGNVSFGTVTGFPLSSAVTNSAGTLNIAKNGSVYEVVKALEQAGLSRVLAEPALTAISGETAKFLAGGEFPVPVPSTTGISIVWKPFGVNVSFKPVVMSEGRISLTVAAEVSELSTAGSVRIADISVPSLRLRRSETTLELPSGGTLAMAGLLSDDTRQIIEGVPGLKDLPVLGTLFRSSDYTRRETELVILVTPYIAKHGPRQEFSRPDDNFAPANDIRALFLGHFNRLYGKPGQSPPRYEGDFGFIIDQPRHNGTKG